MLLKNLTRLATHWQLPLRPNQAQARQDFWRKFQPLKNSLYWTGTVGAAIGDPMEDDVPGLTMMGSELLSISVAVSEIGLLLRDSRHREKHRNHSSFLHVYLLRCCPLACCKPL